VEIRGGKGGGGVPGRAARKKEDERRPCVTREVDEERREKAAVSLGMCVLGGLTAFCSMLLGLPLEPLAGSRVCKLQMQHRFRILLETVYNVIQA
jgi:hypothetical protein